jgi:hypothetical protein
VRFWPGVAAAICLASPSWSAEPTRESCATETLSGGAFAQTPFPALHLIGAASLPTLPTPSAGRVSGIVCQRDDILPTPDDYKILAQYHVPLYIASGDLVAVLQVKNGQLLYEFIKGEAPATEMAEIGGRLDALQIKFTDRQ